MIAVVVPTIRPEQFDLFLKAWGQLFQDYQVTLVVVHDGDTQKLSVYSYRTPYRVFQATPDDVMGKNKDLIVKKSASCRNLGFAYVAKYLPDAEYIFTLDDDETPVDDPFEAHLEILGKRVPVSWMSTTLPFYPRGFPYGVREEAEVIISHGGWLNVPDLDAPTQLLHKHTTSRSDFYRGVLPKGVLAPLSSMNLAFSRKALPYVFHAPMSMEAFGMDRFDDIWMGIDAKRECDRDGYAIATGYSFVYHTRASNVFTNLKKEALGLELNETFWQGDESHPYFKWYRQARSRWQEFVR